MSRCTDENTLVLSKAQLSAISDLIDTGIQDNKYREKEGYLERDGYSDDDIASMQATNALGLEVQSMIAERMSETSNGVSKSRPKDTLTLLVDQAEVIENIDSEAFQNVICGVRNHFVITHSDVAANFFKETEAEWRLMSPTTRRAHFIKYIQAEISSV